jgi:hypothetical protein
MRFALSVDHQIFDHWNQMGLSRKFKYILKNTQPSHNMTQHPKNHFIFQPFFPAEKDREQE